MNTRSCLHQQMYKLGLTVVIMAALAVACTPTTPSSTQAPASTNLVQSIQGAKPVPHSSSLDDQIKNSPMSEFFTSYQYEWWILPSDAKEVPTHDYYDTALMAAGYMHPSPTKIGEGVKRYMWFDIPEDVNAFSTKAVLLEYIPGDPPQCVIVYGSLK